MGTTDATVLEGRLSDPVEKRQIAEVLGVSLATVYDSLRKYRAAVESGDRALMRANIPCHQLGAQGSRFIVPRRAFIEWYLTPGIDEEEVAS